MIDLDALSLKELKQLKKEVDAAVIEYAERERRRALEEVEAFARERGLTVADLNQLVAKKTRKPAAPKYANPEDPSQTWSGRGRRPRWIEAALSDGKSLEDMAI
ncbi:H-NS histone family protein [Rhodobacter sp. NTK016B]|uniref:H-NS histone family protein n=1 Tax=Rhodobacter sp. NTK016B TaxID=2759676 RepID=UPI001A8CB902|nr:H-NS histone family protein [Rhodobacter sp. NTK016B]MBN8292251.1 H-NS histone family protein [Rhodobacter sp. NTK016B]